MTEDGPAAGTVAATGERTGATAPGIPDPDAARTRPVGGRDRPSVVITGASAGVGRATARAFGRLGWQVGLIARDHAALNAAGDEIWRLGGYPHVIRADVADADRLTAAADEMAEAFAGIDVWINNAMATLFAPVDETTAAEFRRVVDVTLMGQVNGTMAALKHMRPADRGTIVLVGSALGHRSIPLQAAYCAAKHGLRGFADSLRSELIHDRSRIRLTTVHLPAVDTPQFDRARSRLPRRVQPVPPIYEPETIADGIVDAVHRAPRDLWIGGSTAQLILGSRFAPATWLDRKMAAMAWDGQMTADPADPSRPDNLFEPVEGDFGARGRFGAMGRPAARRYSPASGWRAAGLAFLGAVTALGMATGFGTSPRRRRRR